MSATTAGPQPVTVFGWDDWTQRSDGKWVSASGKKVYSDPVFQRLKGRAGKAAQKPPAPTLKTPKPAAAGQPAPAAEGHDAIASEVKRLYAGAESDDVTPEMVEAAAGRLAALPKPRLLELAKGINLLVSPSASAASIREQIAARVRRRKGTAIRDQLQYPPSKPTQPQPPPPPPAPAAQPDDSKALTGSLAGATAAITGGKPPAAAATPPKRRTGFTRLEHLMDLSPQKQEEELLKRSARATPEEQVAVRAAAAVRPNPQVTAAVDAQKPALDARFGERASRIFRAVADVFGRVVGAAKDPRMLVPLAGSAVGGGLGAVVGTLVGGPFGVGVGTSVGAGLGLMISDKLGRYMTASRLKVAVRKAIRQTVPAAAGTLAGVGTGAVAMPLAAAGASWAMSPAGIVQHTLGIDTWGSVIKLVGVPFKLAGMVYGRLRKAIEPSAAKGRKRAGETLNVPARKHAEEPDPVAEAKRVMEQAGTDTSAVSDEKVALALAIAAAVEDSAPPGQDVEAFAWDDWKQQPDGRWKSPGGRWISDAKYQAMRQSGAPEPQPGVVGKVADAVGKAADAAGKAMGKTRVGRAVQSADTKAGRVAGKVVQKTAEWKDRKAAALKQKTLEGKFGGLLRWAAGTGVGKAFFRDLERRSQRVQMTAREAQSLGFVGAKLNGAERVVSYVKDNFDRNRRRYGILPAALIESAVFAVKFALPPVIVGAALAGGALGGGAVGGLTAGAAGVGLVRWLAKSLIGKGLTSAARAVGETAAASVKKLLTGKSRVRARKGAPVNLRLAPQPVTANAEGGAGPTVADLIAEVQKRAAEEMGIDLPPEMAADLLTQLAEKMPQAIEQDGVMAV